MSKSGNLAQLSAIFNPQDKPTIYYAEDPPYLPRILVFYWPVQAVGSLGTTSRIRITILSAAGFKNYAAFSVAPSSSFYSAVHKLPEDKQRDDVCRGIAFALCRYFYEVPSEVKNVITDENLHHGFGLKWGQTHAANVTCAMSRVINTDEIIEALRPFSKDPPPIPTVAIRPLASIRKTRPSFLPPDPSHPISIPGRFSTPSKRIPSGGALRIPSSSTKKTPNVPPKQHLEQLEILRFKMCEVVDTEDRYITRLQDLIDLVMNQGRTAKSLSNKLASSRSQKTVNAMLQFPSLLDQIKDLNLAFLDDLESVIQLTEESAIAYLDQPPADDHAQQTKDPIGIQAFAKVLLNHFPKFPMPYRSYLDLHSQISSNLDQFLQEGATSIQILPSLLMEPAQRISRYGLYIDTMLPSIPQSSTIAIRTLEKARKIIAEICEMEPAASTILDSLRIEHEAKKRLISPTKLISGLTRGATITGSMTTREAPAKATAMTFHASNHNSKSLRDRDTPGLLPSLSRTFSRKKSRAGLTGILSEQDPVQAQNIQSPPKYSQQDHQARNDENTRPISGGGLGGLSLRNRFRPGTSGSQSTTTSTTTGSTSSRPVSKGTLMDVLGSGFNFTSHPTVPLAPAVTSLSPGTMAEIDQLKTQLMKLEQENYILLAQNADLKRQIRECRCGGAIARR